jgi:hypothetical protein
LAILQNWESAFFASVSLIIEKYKGVREKKKNIFQAEIGIAKRILEGSGSNILVGKNK